MSLTGLGRLSPLFCKGCRRPVHKCNRSSLRTWRRDGPAQSSPCSGRFQTPLGGCCRRGESPGSWCWWWCLWLCSWTTCCLLWWVRLGSLRWGWSALGRVIHTLLAFSQEWTGESFLLHWKTHRGGREMEETARNGVWSLLTIAESLRSSKSRSFTEHLTKKEANQSRNWHYFLPPHAAFPRTPSGLCKSGHLLTMSPLQPLVYQNNVFYMNIQLVIYLPFWWFTPSELCFLKLIVFSLHSVMPVDKWMLKICPSWVKYMLLNKKLSETNC